MSGMTKDNAADVVRYYNKTESRVGYDLFLRGTKHFGFYRPGDSAWNWQPALRRMEDRLAQELALPQEPGLLMPDAESRTWRACEHQCTD